MLNTGSKDVTKHLIETKIRLFTVVDSALLSVKIDSVSDAERLLSSLIEQTRKSGYWGASVDRMKVMSDTIWATYFMGPKIRWISLAMRNMQDKTTRKHLNKLQNRPFDAAAFGDIQTRILQYYENNGYPFAALTLDSLFIGTDGGMTGIFDLQKGRLIKFNQIRIDGNLKIPQGYLEQVIQINSGDLYSHKKLLRIGQQLRNLSFVEMYATPNVTFYQEYADLTLYLQKKKNGRFDFIIGLLPDPTSEDGQLTLTGNLNADFQNALNLGESFAAEVERLRPETQQLRVKAALPSIAGTAFGASGGLHIFKRDSAWVDAEGYVGVTFGLGGNQSMSILWDNKRSSLQKVDTNQIKTTRRLPDVLDFRQNGFGASFKNIRFDDRFNPRKGWMTDLQITASQFRVLRNSQIENLRDAQDANFRFSVLYDTITLRALRLRYQAQAAMHLPAGARGTVRLGVTANGIFSEKPVLFNEQFRLGGHKLLRGFNEETLLATRLVVTTLEYRLLTGPNSYFSLFSDFGYIENLTNRTTVYQRPIGVGGGINIETRSGIFGLTLAFGKSDLNVPMDFRSAKIHIGYVSSFE